MHFSTHIYPHTQESRFQWYSLAQLCIYFCPTYFLAIFLYILSGSRIKTKGTASLNPQSSQSLTSKVSNILHKCNCE